MIREILKSGNPELKKTSTPVTEADLPDLEKWIRDLRDTLFDYRRTYNAGRAIALPQIGISKRLIYMNTDREYVFVNPTLEFPDDEMFEVLDDCMSFPWVCVPVMRHRHTIIHYYDRDLNACSMKLEGDYSELLQHEYDHLDGILALDRQIGGRFVLNCFGKAEPENAEEILAFYRKAAESKFSAWDEEYPGKREVETDLKAGLLYCLKDKGQIIGTVSVESEKELDGLECWQYTENTAEIARIGVHPSCHGNGIAAWMVSEVEKHLAEEGCKAVHLLAAKQNQPACKTYRRIGYQLRGEVRMYDIDFLACEKRIE